MDSEEKMFIRRDLELMASRLEDQINVIADVSLSRGIEPEKLTLPDGRWALADLLCAKAQVLSALVQLTN